MNLATADPATPLLSLGASGTGLPYLFRVPASWPSPSPDWLAANQGWEPPAGWTPRAEDAPAPAGWTFWERDPEIWSRFTARRRNQAIRGMVVAALVFVAGFLLVVGPQHHASSLDVLFWGAVVFGPIELARNAGELVRLPRTALAEARATAAAVGAELDALAYAELPAEARPHPAEFIRGRIADAWSTDASWPASQRHRPDFAIRESCLSQGRRLAMLVLAGAAAALLIFVLAWSAATGAQGSGAQGSGALEPTSMRHVR